MKRKPEASQSHLEGREVKTPRKSRSASPVEKALLGRKKASRAGRKGRKIALSSSLQCRGGASEPNRARARKKPVEGRELERKRRSESSTRGQETGRRTSRRAGSSLSTPHRKSVAPGKPRVKATASRRLPGGRKGATGFSLPRKRGLKPFASPAFPETAKERKKETGGMGALLASPAPRLSSTARCPSELAAGFPRKKRRTKGSQAERREKLALVSPLEAVSEPKEAVSPLPSFASPILSGFLTSLKKRQPTPQQRGKRGAWRVASVYLRGGEERVGRRRKNAQRASDPLCGETDEPEDLLASPPGELRSLKEGGGAPSRMRSGFCLSETEGEELAGRGAKRKREEDGGHRKDVAGSGEGEQTAEVDRAMERERARQENRTIWERGQALLAKTEFNPRLSPDAYTALWRRTALSRQKSEREKEKVEPGVESRATVKREGEKDSERKAQNTAEEKNAGQREETQEETKPAEDESNIAASNSIACRRPLRRCRVLVPSPSSSSSSSSSSSAFVSSSSSSSSCELSGQRRRSARLRQSNDASASFDASLDSQPQKNTCESSVPQNAASSLCADDSASSRPVSRGPASPETSAPVSSLSASSHFRHCTPYVRSLARRAGWERVPPSLLLLFVEDLGAALSRGLRRRRNRRRDDRDEDGVGLSPPNDGAERGANAQGVSGEKPEKRRLGEVERLLQVQNEWERAKAVSMWKRARSQGAVEGESLKDIRSRLRGHAHPVGCMLAYDV
ncbi:conserved hypothetical protein [Neospora caninum Liverpool]|nr:conserved hypothetical protein [Neospora caninum Liverpool]CBZ52452.1 conserved hypothetical protein [Neospora caninum Liverpool]|eukprot:XP_003882484.1 conserved hypothetical protein [Neospora caninum Liverpool]